MIKIPFPYLYSEPIHHNGLLAKLFGGFLILTLPLLYSCDDDPDCMDIDYGKQYMSDSTKNLFAYQGGENLVFKDSLNRELTFDIIPPFGKIYLDWLGYMQDVTEGTCIGEMKIRCELQMLLVNFKNDSLNYYIIYEQRVHSLIQGITPIYYDIMSVHMYNQSQNPASWGIKLNRVLDPKGNEDYFADKPVSYEYADTLTLNSKSFEQVYFETSPDGSALYFNHDLGFVGFKERNKPLWVLDRIE